MFRDFIDMLTGSGEYDGQPPTQREIVLEEVCEAEQMGMIPSLGEADIYEHRGCLLVRRVAGHAGERYHQMGIVTGGPPYIVDGNINTGGMTVDIEPSFMRCRPRYGNMALNDARTKGYKGFCNVPELKEWMVEANGNETLEPLVADTVDRSVDLLRGNVF